MNRIGRFMLFLLLAAPIGYIAAQTEELEPRYRATIWIARSTDEDGEVYTDSETGEPLEGTETAFLEYEDGLIIVWPGPDYVFTGNPDDGFTGSFLVADPDITVTSELTFVDEDTRFEVRSAELFGMEQVEYFVYTRTDEEIEIWSESERNFTETTLLFECFDRDPAPLSFGWTAPDILMPIRFYNDGTIVMDYREYVGGEHRDIEEPDSNGNVTVVTRTLDVGTDSIGFRLHGIMNGRDDCEMIYESTFTPFDGDFDALFARAEEIGEE